MNLLRAVAVFALLLAPACRSTDQPLDERGRGPTVEGDRQDPNGTCQDSCGGKSPDGCWCNVQCEQYNDCCPDYQAVCVGDPAPDPGASCVGNCGNQAPNGCWCDQACTGYGDCCEDYEPACVNPPGPDAGPGDPDAATGPDAGPDAGPVIDAAPATDPWSDLSNGPLIDALGQYTTSGHNGLSYDQARNHIYGAYGGTGIDIHNGVIECIYTGLQIPPDGTRFPSGMINTEHSWPRSDGANVFPREGDLHHLFPTEVTSNSTRSSYDFGETTCTANACNWYDGGSELGYDTVGKTVFQVRAKYRGDIARAHFYFSVRYDLAIPDDEESVLRAWNDLDPPDLEERTRNDDIEGIQGNRNPFVDYPHLDDRINNF